MKPDRPTGSGARDGSSRTDVPARVAWAVDGLDAQPNEQILEIGCGPGVAAALIAERLRNGRLVAIDRSATAVDRARRRNAAHCTAGTVEVVHASLAELTVPDDAFDRVFAINVNLFWTGGAAELDVVRRVLRPGGLLHLFYEPPATAKVAEIRRRAASVLGAAGFRIAGEHEHPLGRVVGLHMIVELSVAGGPGGFSVV
jgi:SAM-dependent methyltransferase